MTSASLVLRFRDQKGPGADGDTCGSVRARGKGTCAAQGTGAGPWARLGPDKARVRAVKAGGSLHPSCPARAGPSLPNRCWEALCQCSVSLRACLEFLVAATKS